MNENNYVAIMAGGVGSRFWPVSRSGYPKQFLDILNTGKTFLQSTYERFLSFVPNENIYIVTSAGYVDIVKEQLPDLPHQNILGEPERKNTAPCVAYIAFKLKQQNPDANMIVAPSDHLITDADGFQRICQQALDFTARRPAFVTLGITPTFANTGYGYIRFKKEPAAEGIFPVEGFTEKPDASTAQGFLHSGNYLWNAGIFIWKASDIVDAFKAYSENIHNAFADRAEALNTDAEGPAVEEAFAQCEPISIDYAVMEEADNVYVIPSSFGWSDLGTWNSAWEAFDRDENENAVAGENTLVMGAKGCLIHSSDKKLVLVGGVDDLIIVNTPDALLVCKKENEQQIKEYVAKVKQTKGEAFI